MTDDSPLEDAEFEDEETHSVIRAKWVFDGATTLSEAAAMLRGFADSLEAMEADGWQLVAAVNDDYGFIERREA